jgi:hypothetical protein
MIRSIREFPMKRTLATIALAATLLMPTGLLSIAATAASASPPKLSAMLLGIDQMPTGWSVGPSSGSGHAGCYGNVLEPKGIKQTASASVYFEANGGLPAVDEKLATYTNAKTAYAKVVASLAACKHFSGTSAGEKITGTMGQMSFPHYGDASEAFAVTLTVQGTTAYDDLLIVRKGIIVMGIDEGNVAPVNVSQFQGFVNKAVAKLSPTTASAKNGNGSSPSSPVPFGKTASVDGWTVKVLSVAPESTDPNVGKPPKGYLFEIDTLQVTRTAATPDSPIDLDPELLGPTHAVRSVDSSPMCWGGNPYNDQVYKGGTVMTSDCISVPVADASGLVVGVGDLEGNPTWFATK